MADEFSNVADQVSAPATRCVGVVPSDDAALADIPKALYVGSGGDLVLQAVEGDAVTFANLPDGALLPVRARQVHATGTTAAAIVALY